MNDPPVDTDPPVPAEVLSRYEFMVKEAETLRSSDMMMEVEGLIGSSMPSPNHLSKEYPVFGVAVRF